VERQGYMGWSITSRDERTGRVGVRRYDAEAEFIRAAKIELDDIWKRLIFATLPDGTVLLDEKVLDLLASH
jgi:hypothetical protein